MYSEQGVSIWFFIGALLAVYGVLILGSGVYGVIFPLPESERVALWDLHADIWWGALMTIVGLFYCAKFNPFGKTGGERNK